MKGGLESCGTMCASEGYVLTRSRLFNQVCIFCQEVFSLLLVAMGYVSATGLHLLAWFPSVRGNYLFTGECQLSSPDAVKYLRRRVDSTMNLL